MPVARVMSHCCAEYALRAPVADEDARERGGERIAHRRRVALPHERRQHGEHVGGGDAGGHDGPVYWSVTTPSW